MTTLADTCAELATLIGKLADALERDNTTTGRGGDPAGRVPVNPDVLHAIITISKIPDTTRDAAEATGEAWAPRSVHACLLAIPRLTQRLTTIGERTHAQHLESDVHWWTRVTKQALGLRTPDRPIGHDCPNVDHDGPPTELIAAGSEGFPRHGRDGLTVEWVHAARIYCPTCGASWGPGEWTHLGNVLTEVPA